jgi:hypothetical protein
MAKKKDIQYPDPLYILLKPIKWERKEKTHKTNFALLENSRPNISLYNRVLTSV